MSDNTEGKPRRDRGRRRRGGRSGAPKTESVESREQAPRREAQTRRDGAQRNTARSEQGGRRETPQRKDGGNRRDSGVRKEPARRDDALRADPLARRDIPRQDAPKRERRIEIDLPPPPKLPTPLCPRCGEPITDITSALTDRDSGTPVHFDCAVKFLEGAENIGETQKIVYIGQGRFAVMEFENPADMKKFHIVRTIEWESRESRAEWRGDIASQFSQVR